ncbi:hypothetical protein T01_6762 [Trichinella spiralis]|uniref:Uncharacterized protein n=1 Tax=Trichinella spiralis TaxID=6334 RepID=A0A0V1BIM4_TRISP|nr:hypothetical protein T01_6762 [Trichinella spiralis]
MHSTMKNKFMLPAPAACGTEIRESTSVCLTFSQFVSWAKPASVFCAHSARPVSTLAFEFKSQ